MQMVSSRQERAGGGAAFRLKPALASARMQMEALIGYVGSIMSEWTQIRIDTKLCESLQALNLSLQGLGKCSGKGRRQNLDRALDL